MGRFVRRYFQFIRRMLQFRGKLAIAGRFPKRGTRRLDKKEAYLIIPVWPAKRVASHHDPRAAMPLALVVECELNFRPNPERPLGQQADAFGRPVNLFLNQID
jgi:hypothetical protein